MFKIVLPSSGWVEFSTCRTSLILIDVIQ